MFSDKDLQQIQERGSDLETVKEQIRHFENDFPSLELTETPLIGNGISQVDEEEKARLISLYENRAESLTIVKFVPASGAATRMFKELFAFLSEYDGSEAAYNKLVEKGEKNAVYKFLKNLRDFAFYEDLKAAYRKRFGQTLEEGHLKREYKNIIDTLLSDEGLGYGALPKALLKFHQYDKGARTSLEEHFVEGARYAKGKENVVALHFTVSPNHKDKFESTVAAIKEKYEESYGVKYMVSYSIQKPATDTIAVDMENKPFRNEDNSLLFRPAGHGALIENLNELDADIIFVKNIDNVVPERIQQETYKNKKLLAGLLISTKDQVAGHLKTLQSAGPEDDFTEIENFIFNDLLIRDNRYATLTGAEKIEYLHSKLNRPIRVCGVVKNDGDPGGGPFFAKNPDGSVSLQIVETAQVDTNNANQNEIFSKATHFNPVDLVCSTRDVDGKPFNLLEYRDLNTGFITKKSKDGRDLKAQELPGLWNGAMSDWITIFVEVPVITFNPVKSVNNLLIEEHQ
ncbi:MAG: DUF4301 family protein [Cyclobacteriaceae bacterium]